MLKANVEIKLNDDGDRWYVAACSANIDNNVIHPLPSGELFHTKDAAITEMKRRIMEWFKEKGRTETEEKVKCEFPEDLNCTALQGTTAPFPPRHPHQ